MGNSCISAPIAPPNSKLDPSIDRLRQVVTIVKEISELETRMNDIQDELNKLICQKADILNELKDTQLRVSCIKIDPDETQTIIQRLNFLQITVLQNEDRRIELAEEINIIKKRNRDLAEQNNALIQQTIEAI